MTKEQLDVLLRAAEAGHFTAEVIKWWNAEPYETDESEAAQSFAAKAVALLDDPSVYWAVAYGHDHTMQSGQPIMNLSDADYDLKTQGDKVWSAARRHLWPEA